MSKRLISDANITVPLPSISRLHATFDVPEDPGADEIIVTDEKSANGTYSRAMKLERGASVAVKHGESVFLATKSIMLMFERRPLRICFSALAHSDIKKLNEYLPVLEKICVVHKELEGATHLLISKQARSFKQIRALQMGLCFIGIRFVEVLVAFSERVRQLSAKEDAMKLNWGLMKEQQYNVAGTYDLTPNLERQTLFNGLTFYTKDAQLKQIIEGGSGVVVNESRASDGMLLVDNGGSERVVSTDEVVDSVFACKLTEAFAKQPMNVEGSDVILVSDEILTDTASDATFEAPPVNGTEPEPPLQASPIKLSSMVRRNSCVHVSEDGWLCAKDLKVAEISASSPRIGMKRIRKALVVNEPLPGGGKVFRKVRNDENSLELPCVIGKDQMVRRETKIARGALDEWLYPQNHKKQAVIMPAKDNDVALLDEPKQQLAEQTKQVHRRGLQQLKQKFR